VGAAGALVLAALYQRLSWKMLQETSTETIKVTAMVFAILVGATAFSMGLDGLRGNAFKVEQTKTKRRC
jgi:TRAP-type mannitol/chloroaromatic compound transport system permease large subunit